jgi:hypothetical protein
MLVVFHATINFPVQLQSGTKDNNFIPSISQVPEFTWMRVAATAGEITGNGAARVELPENKAASALEAPNP